MATQGYTSIGAETNIIAASGADRYLYQKFVIANRIALEKVTAVVYKSSGSNAETRVVVKSDSSGVPGTLLLATDYTNPTNTTATFVDHAFSGAPNTLNAGTYWIGLEGVYNGLGTASTRYDTGGETDSAVQPTSDVNPAPSLQSWNVSVYITYELLPSEPASSSFLLPI